MKLNELFDFLPKSKRNASFGQESGIYPFFTSSNIVNKYVNQEDYDGEFLIIGDGGTGNCKYFNGKFSVSDHNYLLQPRNSCNPKCVRYFLMKDNFKVLNDGFHGAGIKNVSKTYIQNINYHHNEKYSEKYIVDALERLEKLILLKNEQLSKLDELVKSRFIEMFIDKGYPEITLKELSSNGGEYGACSAAAPFDKDRPRYIRITDINDDGSLNNDAVCSSNIEDDEAYKLSYGDFLFARMGATVGKTYVYTEGNYIYAGYLIRFKLNLDKMKPQYLFAYTKLDRYDKWVKLNQSGAAQPGINASKYANLAVPCAPIDLQNTFAEFVKQIDKSKFVSI